ncbi:hypothetical protein M0802_007892 [Mischocyttarus mexicanus]|nr:hypothetical protein M0802_007892 [Mischocyttarus mexicanus]
MASKAQKTVNAVWGMWRRAGIKALGKRLYLLDAIVKSAYLYGAELWGWEKWEEIERVQGRFVKMMLGVNGNTPGFIWRMEAERSI